MSLHALAGHMATKGRGGDSLLVHMTPGEVAGLQALAVKHGGELTINPETGLPEANFLKQILPMVAGFALGPAGFGLMSAGMAGLTVGGLTTLATGSLSRGLMAGMGAYGGAGLAEGLMGSGIGAAQEAAMAGVGEGASQAAMNEAAAKATTDFMQKGALDRFTEGAGAAFNDPKGFVQGMGGMGKLAQTGLAAIAPIMADQGVQTTTPRQDTGNIRRFSYDPYGQTYTPQGVFPAAGYKGMAQGGIVALAEGGSIEDLYTQYAGRAADPGGLQYWQQQFGDTIDPNEINIFKTAVAEARAQGTEPNDVTQAQANDIVQNMYRNVLNRDVEQSGLNYWSDMIQSTNDPNRIYRDFLTSAKANTELGNFGMGYEQAVTPFQGYMSADTGSNADEWVRNVLKREVTDADRNQSWYKDMAGVTTAQEAKDAYSDFLRSTGAKTDLDWMAASQLNPLLRPRTTPQTYAPQGTTNPYGNVFNPGDKTFNPDGSITVQPNIPGRPYGGFTGMGQVRDAYTQGGGSLGYVNPAPKTMEEFDQRFNRQTGDSLAAYNYLMGKGANPIKSGVGEIMRPYSEATLGMPVAEGRPNQKYVYENGRYVENPNYVPVTYDTKGNRVVGISTNEVLRGFRALPDQTDDAAIFDWVDENKVTIAQLAAAMGITEAEARRRMEAIGKTKGATINNAGYISNGGGDGPVSGSGSNTASNNAPVESMGFDSGFGGDGANAGAPGGGSADGGPGSSGDGGTGDSGTAGDAGWAYGGQVKRMALGGLGALAGGGQAGYNLGGYSDGGRLLRGPGDGVSDSIPATIGDKQPARLANNEFVIPARIVSELGNGSTDAGARKLYAMMDRVQKARGKTVGKGKVAVDSKADRFLPA